MMSIFVFAVIASFTCQTLEGNPNCVELGYYSNLDEIAAPISYTINRRENSLLHLVGIDCPETAAPKDHRIHTIDETFYRYSVTPSTGEVDGIKKIHNDIDSLIFMVEQAEKEHLAFSNSQTLPSNDVLAFFRSFNKNYYPFSTDTYFAGIGWVGVAGTGNEAFNASLGTTTKHGLSFKYYLGPLLKKTDFNKDYYGDILPLPSYTNIIDPFCSNNFIDACHFFASLDGCFSKTLAQNLVQNDLYANLSSWAGDLQSEAKEYNGSSSFEDILDNANGSFSYNDLSADIDAINVARLYLNSTNFESNALSSSLNSYYGGANQARSLESRYQSFVENVVRPSPGTTISSVCFQFCQLVCSYLHLNLSSGGAITESSEQATIDIPMKFYLLKNKFGQFPVFSNRVSLAKKFSQHIIAKCGGYPWECPSL